MPRILGIDLPKEKRIEAALPYIYGIGPTRTRQILSQAQISGDKRAKDLTEEEISRITGLVQKNYVTEGDLRREINENVRRHMEIGTYRAGTSEVIARALWANGDGHLDTIDLRVFASRSRRQNSVGLDAG